MRRRQLSAKVVVNRPAALPSSIRLSLPLMPRILYSLKDFPAELRGGAVAIGNFDGVHRGHASLVNALTEQAKSANIGAVDRVHVSIRRRSVCCIPSACSRRRLTSIERRAELLHELGVDLVVAYPTDRALLQLSAENFSSKFLSRRCEQKPSSRDQTFASGAIDWATCSCLASCVTRADYR